METLTASNTYYEFDASDPIISIVGTWDGATATTYIKNEYGDYVALTETRTADGESLWNTAGRGKSFKVAIAGGSGSESLAVNII